MGTEIIDLAETRKRIVSCKDPFVRATLAAMYICCARVSEIVAYPIGKERAYGPTVQDIERTTFMHGDREVPIVVFNVKTAKRNGLLRKCAIPIEHEPLLKYVLFHQKLVQEKLGGGPMFPVNRRWLWERVKALGVFDGIKYKIFPYINENEKVPEHDNDAALHYLRHARATELFNYYRFDAEECAAFGGWTFSSARGTPISILTPVMTRYVYLDYTRYLPKLMKPPPC
ncbi:MAG: hypothetical protein ABC527_06135 [Candidatus Methanosuratincola petrocarbonis]